MFNDGAKCDQRIDVGKEDKEGAVVGCNNDGCLNPENKLFELLLL